MNEIIPIIKRKIERGMHGDLAPGKMTRRDIAVNPVFHTKGSNLN